MGYGGGINLYGYCGNGPVEGSDPLGLADGDDDGAGSFYANALNQGWNGPGGVGEGFADGSQERGKFSQFLHQIPGVGTVLGAADAATGCDYVAGTHASTFQRVMGGVGVVLAGAGFIARGLGAGEEAVVGESDEEAIALGRFDQAEGRTLSDFAKEMSSENETVTSYKDPSWMAERGNYNDAFDHILDRMNRAPRIYFSLHDVNVEKALDPNFFSLKPNAIWELKQILENPELYAKTFFAL